MTSRRAREVDRASSRLSTIIGPCYTTASIASALGVTVDEVERLTEDGELLALTTADGHTVYPSFQVEQGVLIEHLGDVLRILRVGTDDPWIWALWLRGHPNSPTSGATHPSRLGQLRAGDTQTVLAAAAHTAHAWRS